MDNLKALLPPYYIQGSEERLKIIHLILYLPTTL